MGDIIDLFETETPEPPASITLPPEIKFDAVEKAWKSNTPEPAFTIVSKKKITGTEHKLITAILDKITSFKSKYGNEEQVIKELLGLKKTALEALASNFGITSVSQLKKQNLNFNIKDNYEVELLRRRSERGTS